MLGLGLERVGVLAQTLGDLVQACVVGTGIGKASTGVAPAAFFLIGTLAADHSLAVAGPGGVVVTDHLPALRIALPAYSNEVILMLHSTALAFTATVPDLLKIARDINSATYQPFTAFGIAAVLYLIISYVLISLFRKAEKRWLQHIKPSSTH